MSMQYKHVFVQGLEEFIRDFLEGSSKSNPMIGAIWMGIRGELPNILASLDENPEAIEAIRTKIAFLVEATPQPAAVLPAPEWHKFVEEFNEAFGPPFLPEGFAMARLAAAEMRIQIGDRDSTFDAHGESQGSGSRVGDASRWEISRKPDPESEEHAGDKPD